MRRLSIIVSATAVAVLVIALALMAGSSDVARAAPDVVDAGYDLLETDGGGPTFMDFNNAPIPADFFDPGSDPFTSSVVFEGVPIGSFDPGGGPISPLGSTSTIVQRLQDAGTAGFPAAPIAIEIVALHLQSVNPITVTENGGQNPELWDLDVQLAPNQVQGTMTIDHEFTDGGTFDANLPVKPLLTFTMVDPPNDVRVLDGDAEGLTIPFQATGENWCHNANPLQSPPGQWVIEMTGLTSNFFPGITCQPDQDVRIKNYFALDAQPLAVHAVQPAEVPSAVGGLGDFPDVEEPVVGSAGSSGGSSFPYAAVAGGLAALGLVAAGGVYARRRFSRS